MKILLLGEYSNVHNTLAIGLRKLGHQVTVASNGDFWKDYPRDINLDRDMSSGWGTLSFMWRLIKALPRMRGYDIVQLISPLFLELKAEHIMPFYRYLRRHNGKILMGSFGIDYYWTSVNTYIRPLRYSDFNFGDRIRTDNEALIYQKEWIGTPKQTLSEAIATDCDGIIAGLYEYWATYNEVHTLCPDGREIRDKMRFIPYPIVMPEIYHTSYYGGPLKLFIGISRNRSAYKGTDIMLSAAKKISEKYPDSIELRIAEGVPFDEYRRLMDGSDAILDQLYSYTPSMNSLLAMSKGIIVVGGGEPENYEILNENELRPIINVEPSEENVYNQLEQLILHTERIPELKRQSVEYIKRHHDYIKVAQQYLDFYSEL
ncbi:MAG: glycosyltransferase family 1 protein [Bacteroidaceae bacterium]|nr:glycosyltransferase family 1 protein [Bacteroidaceae bacterium]